VDDEGDELLVLGVDPLGEPVCGRLDVSYVIQESVNR
jgi:hypothetical protein